MPIIQHILQDGINRLNEAEIPSAALDAELLLVSVIKKDRVFLIAHSDKKLTAAQIKLYQGLIRKRAKRIPLAYLTGSKEFYGLNFKVTPAVLIPRPETELLVDAVKDWLTMHPLAHRMIDIGVGSGAIPCALASSAKQLRIVIGVDLSPKAIKLAKENVAALKLGKKISIEKSDLLESVQDKFDIITANLPYLSAQVYRDAVKLFPEIDYEPKEALYAADHGLACIKQLIRQAPEHLYTGGAMILEIGSEQGQSVSDYAKKYFPQGAISVIQDGCGKDRVVVISL